MDNAGLALMLKRWTTQGFHWCWSNGKRRASIRTAAMDNAGLPLMQQRWSTRNSANSTADSHDAKPDSEWLIALSHDETYDSHAETADSRPAAVDSHAATADSHAETFDSRHACSSWQSRRNSSVSVKYVVMSGNSCRYYSCNEWQLIRVLQL